MNLIIYMIRDTATIVSQKVTVAILDNWSLVLRWWKFLINANGIIYHQIYSKNSDTVN